jgi:hypothetical protein
MIDSVSKRYSMCGARIGALISKNKEVMSAALKFGQARLSPPTIDQIASEAALQTPQKYFDDVVSEYVTRRNIMVDGLNAIPGVFCPKPSGAFYCVAKFPVDNAEKFCQWLLEDFEFEGQSYLFWEYIRILNAIQKYNPNVRFLLENVSMTAKWQKVLTQAIGINPIFINNKLLSIYSNLLSIVINFIYYYSSNQLYPPLTLKYSKSVSNSRSSLKYLSIV